MASSSTASSRAGNVVLVSHCDFTGNSAFHVLGVARELHRRGLSPVICIPSNKESVGEVGAPPFPVLTYDEAQAAPLPFPDGRGPDLIHAFTPREQVRTLTESLSSVYSCRYVVHLEDNEAVLLDDDLSARGASGDMAPPVPLLDVVSVTSLRSHPVRSARFVNRASGMTVLIESLLEFKPEHVPGAVFWPGFETEVLDERPTAVLRDELGLAPDDLVLAYTGNVHNSNVGEVRSLYIAVGLLRRAGLPVKLVKTGWNHVDMSWVRDCVSDGAVLDLGFVSRDRLWDLLAVADILVQPGSSGPFNDYRFPSKLPDFLAAGKPVVLPATNIGLHLVDGEEALLLHRGDAAEIFDAVRRIADDPELRAALGENGRTFALRNLTWERNVEPIVELYGKVANGAPAAPRVAEAGEHDARLAPPVKLVSFYLPQFHPIPENDEWWGEGFTEWTNVNRARPQFDGHDQPQLPGELGFYDLRDPEVLDRQAELARSYGIYGFCFYYYWFNGRRVLERPVDQMLARGEPDFPFCFCWANENWTRRWDGGDDDVLLGQEFSPGWDERFIRELLPAFADRRYMRVEGSPMLLVYRANVIPDVERAVERWRAIALAESGLTLHLAAVQSFEVRDPRPYGFDAAVEFPPHTEHVLVDHARLPGVSADFRGYFEDYPAVMRQQLDLELPDYRWYRGVMPSWDNTARRGPDAHILVNSSPEAYRTWLRKIVLQTLCRSPVDEPLVFLNAWNEWAEGNHLEPDERLGRAWLEATEGALHDGLRQYYASIGFELSDDQVSAHLRDVLETA